MYGISSRRSRRPSVTYKCHQHQPVVDAPAAAVAKEFDREPHNDKEEGDGEEDRQGGNIILLGPRRDATLALAQAFGDEALLDRAVRCYAFCDQGLVATIDAEAGCISRRAGRSAAPQHGHGAVDLQGDETVSSRPPTLVSGGARKGRVTDRPVKITLTAH